MEDNNIQNPFSDTKIDVIEALAAVAPEADTEPSTSAMDTMPPVNASIDNGTKRIKEPMDTQDIKLSFINEGNIHGFGGEDTIAIHTVSLTSKETLLGFMPNTPQSGMHKDYLVGYAKEVGFEWSENQLHTNNVNFKPIVKEFELAIGGYVNLDIENKHRSSNDGGIFHRASIGIGGGGIAYFRKLSNGAGRTFSSPIDLGLSAKAYGEIEFGGRHEAPLSGFVSMSGGVKHYFDIDKSSAHPFTDPLGALGIQNKTRYDIKLSAGGQVSLVDDKLTLRGAAIIGKREFEDWDALVSGGSTTLDEISSPNAMTVGAEVSLNYRF